MNNLGYKSNINIIAALCLTYDLLRSIGMLNNGSFLGRRLFIQTRMNIYIEDVPTKLNSL